MSKILVVEDEITLLEALISKLKKEGMETFEARDGQSGLNMALKIKPDLIMLDVIMPVMDGMTMLKKLREDEWGKTVPVILLTNLRSPERAEEAFSSGVYDYLVKVDWKLDEVMEKIKEKLNTP